MATAHGYQETLTSNTWKYGSVSTTSNCKQSWRVSRAGDGQHPGNTRQNPAYAMFFTGSTKFDGATLLWKTWAPPNVKLFLFFALHKRTSTAERRKRHGLQEEDTCALCDQLPEHVNHLLISRPVARQVRWGTLTSVGLPRQFNGQAQNILQARRTTRHQTKQGP